jgi:2-polyprenyl-3-methyl-5-hydroxy-6-metoxy-1,4-benzoquinol methylase
MTLVTVPCDLCGSTAFEPMYPGNISSDDADPSAYFSSSRSQAGHWPIVRCANCGLVMANPHDDEATLAQVYASLQDAVYDAEDDNRRRTAQRFLALVEKFKSPSAQLLDVGCATGMFADEAHKSGWHVTGLEASEWAVARARKRCPQATFIAGFLEEADLSGSFDVITAWDVLEHVSRPSQILKRIHGWLAEDGWLFLNVPNVESWVARLMGRRWVLLLREHVWYYSPATIAALLRQAGFEMICTRTHVVQFSMANVLGRAAQYPGVAGRLSLRWANWSWLKRVTIRFPMGEMNVVARKAS